MTSAARGLRVVYVGARIVGRECLETLLAAQVDIVGLLYLDDALAGNTVAHASYSDLIDAYGLNARAFRSLRESAWVDWLKALRPDVGIVVGVSQLLDEQMLTVPRLGFIGMHPTLLPVGRGRAPIPWALIKGLKQTGVSLFWCEPGADTGPLLAQRAVPVYYEDTAASLGARTDRVASELLVHAMGELARGEVMRIPQDERRASIWPKRRPEDGLIDWTCSGRQIYDWVRALTQPYPGAFTFAAGRKLIVWACRESHDLRRGDPGAIIDVLPHGVLVACGEGSVLLTRLQWESEVEKAPTDIGLVIGRALH